MSFQIPPYLKSGDLVAVVATARVVNTQQINFALDLLSSWGLKVQQGAHLFDEDQLFAGSDQHRFEDLQEALNNPSIKAIFCARGGYGTTRILDRINWDIFKQQPKWICGFSDVTALLTQVLSLKIACIHGPMPQLFQKGESSGDPDFLKQIMFGAVNPAITAEAHPDNAWGRASGVLIGGNLSILAHLMGSSTTLDTNHKILFLEEVDEYQYAIDRMMVQLKRAGLLQRLSGLIVGHLTKVKTGDLKFDKPIEGVIRHHMPPDIPVAFGFPCGHEHPNKALLLGKKVELEVTEKGSSLSF